MAFCYGRQFRRIAAQALTADPDEMRVLIECILPAREDSGVRALRLKSQADCDRAPAVVVAAFFADAITGDEAAHLLAHATNPATRKQVQQERREAEDPLAKSIRAWREARPKFDEYRAQHPELVARWEREAAERRSAAKKAAALVNNKRNTSEPCCDAAVTAPERPP